jgi:hypothetical protein
MTHVTRPDVGRGNGDCAVASSLGAADSRDMADGHGTSSSDESEGVGEHHLCGVCANGVGGGIDLGSD